MNVFHSLYLSVECETLTGSTHDGTRVKHLFRASLMSGEEKKVEEPSCHRLMHTTMDKHDDVIVLARNEGMEVQQVGPSTVTTTSEPKPLPQQQHLSVLCSDRGLFFAQSYEEKIDHLENELSELSFELNRISERKNEIRRMYPQRTTSKTKASKRNEESNSPDEYSEGLSLLLTDLLDDSYCQGNEKMVRDDPSEVLVSSPSLAANKFGSVGSDIDDDLSELLADKFMSQRGISEKNESRPPDKEKADGIGRRRKLGKQKSERERRAEEFDAVFLNSEITVEIPIQSKPIPKKRRNTAPKKGTLDDLLQVSPRHNFYGDSR